MFQKGQLLVELILAIGLAALILPVILTGLMTSREGKPQQEKRVQAVALMKETVTAIKNIRDADWATFSSVTTNTAYHPVISSNRWVLQPGVATNSAGLTQSVVVNDVYRTSAGAIATSPTGNFLDPSTKKVDVTISWTQPIVSSTTSTVYLTRTTNLTYSHNSSADFTPGTLTDVQISTNNGGEIKLANNNRAKWCTPGFATATIDLPDGPPVAVAATASATSIAIPNDVFVATAPYASSSVKLAYVNVDANVATPAATQRGIFTLDASKYTSGTYPSSLGGLTNNFKTNDIKYYKSSSGNVYALIATDLPTHEVVIAQIKNNNGASDAYQDSANKIYKYWSYFSTKIHSSSTSNDYAPFGYGAVSLAVLENRGYVISGGYLYVFDLTNIDSATATTSLPMVGCRIQLDGYDCNPGSGQNKKYSAGQTGNTSWSDTSTPTHNDCSDGGNVELYASNDITPIKVGTSTYVYVAVGAGTNPELNIVNVTSVPTGSTSPTLTNNSCGRISGGASGWRRIGSLDFNSASNTEEAANSVFAKSDGTRAYISSNGGVDANGDGQADSKQFYVINTTTKNAPAFLSGTTTATSGYYSGGSPAPSADAELFPRRSLTVLNGLRAVLVGKDGFTNGNDAEEYQVLEMDNPSESAPRYCGGLNYNVGFNDLTSVSELDSDNFVYMIANTTLNELKIIEGGPDNAIYVASGTYVSPVFDTASLDASTLNRAFNRFLADIVQPAGTSIGFQMAVAQASGGVCPTSIGSYQFLGPNKTTDVDDLFKSMNNGSFALDGLIPLLTSGSYSNPGRCFRYKAYLTSSEQTATPELQRMIWNYSQ